MATTLTPKQLERNRKAARKGGESLKAKLGRQHYQVIGHKGYDTVMAKMGRVWHVKGGEASWAKQNAEFITSGGARNQHPRQWGYTADQMRRWGYSEAQLRQWGYVVDVTKNKVLAEESDQHMAAIQAEIPF